MEAIDYRNVPQVTLSYSVPNLKERYKITHSQEVENVIRPFFEDFIYHHEELWCILTNQAGCVLGVLQVCLGTVNGSLVNQLAIFQAAILSNASGLILVHNHPSGSNSPSPQDNKLTEEVKIACKLFNIQLLDHLILLPEGYFSFADQGQL